MLFRFAITAVFVYPLHRIARLASTSTYLPLIHLVFSLFLPLARDPFSPRISHYAPSLTLSPRSSAKTSIRLSPVAPRYTDPTRASRRAPRVPRGNVDSTSLPRLAVTTNVTHEHHVLPARDSQHITVPRTGGKIVVSSGQILLYKFLQRILHPALRQIVQSRQEPRITRVERCPSPA